MSGVRLAAEMKPAIRTSLTSGTRLGIDVSEQDGPGEEDD
jgi:hypothetical protein